MFNIVMAYEKQRLNVKNDKKCKLHHQNFIEKYEWGYVNFFAVSKNYFWLNCTFLTNC